MWRSDETKLENRRIFEEMRARLNYTATYDLNVRVTKAMYSRPDQENKVRLSVITRDARQPSGVNWEYSKQFTYMWTDNYLHTAIVDVDAGGTTGFVINNEKVEVKLPGSGKATSGFMFADVCFTQDSWCQYGGRYWVFNRHTDLINAAAEQDDIDFWYIIGDNFYHSDDGWTKSFFDALNTPAKSKCSGMSLGNHDFWVGGSSGAAGTYDQLGIGMTQYYAMDTMASVMKRNGEPYDWSKEPWNHFWDSPPPISAENTIAWTKIGNVAFIFWSGAFPWEAYEAYFDQACQEFSNDGDISFLMLLSHWDGANLGCQWGMDAPSVYNTLKDMKSCSSFKYRMKYVDGHDHSNTAYGTGFKIGANGMSGTGQTGTLYTKTSDEGEVWVYYIEFANNWGGDYFDGFLDCVKRKGLDNCLDREGVYLWHNQPPLDPQCWEQLERTCTYQGQSATCMERIDWLISNNGMDFMEAYEKVQKECGRVCQCVMGPTKKPTTGPPTPKPIYGPCDEMLSNSACDQDGCHSCGDRINWLEDHGSTAAEAYAQVAEEFPGTCQCDNPPTGGRPRADVIG